MLVKCHRLSNTNTEKKVLFNKVCDSVLNSIIFMNQLLQLKDIPFLSKSQSHYIIYVKVELNQK